MADSLMQSNLSPDETLAATISDAISKANLVSAQKLPLIRDGLAKGNLSAVDWKLFTELAMPSEDGEDSL